MLSTSRPEHLQSPRTMSTFRSASGSGSTSGELEWPYRVASRSFDGSHRPRNMSPSQTPPTPIPSAYDNLSGDGWLRTIIEESQLETL
ncbi:hypothetical protein AXG93_1040s1400 [Marchantia polymorpha subsp. ruderalis]|uniref:Uncharacterized protein n=1 Tax=Marchantia polymorpha subsp. ruderalis TaxID=1480154 RepID=A0A176VI56_MARPO|nr:hypothetical protein AXG93_1040s1400 [Marchantia polymorpha subsp. ruderalis]